MIFKKIYFFCLLFLGINLLKAFDDSEISNDDIEISKTIEESEPPKAFHEMVFNDIGEEIEYITKYEKIKPKIEREIEVNYRAALSKLLVGGIDQLLALDLYKKTHTILKRPITSLPIFEIFHTEHMCQNSFFKFHFFGDINRAFYTNSSPFIKSFLAIDDPEYVDRLNKLKAVTDIDFDEVIELFKHAKKDERKLGLMIQAFKNFNNTSFEFTIPLLYQEYNYFLTPEEQQRIIDSTFFSGTEQRREEEFRKDAVSDKFGLGDAKVRIGWTFVEKENFCLKSGIQSTIPIAFPFKKGLIGSYFKNKIVRPGINLRTLLEIQANDVPEFNAILKDFGFQALNWLSAIVLESPLGNYGHFGLGLFIEPHFKIDECVTLNSKFSFEYLFPAREDRFFLVVKNPNDFNNEQFRKDRESEAASKKAIEFFDKQVINTLFPQIFTTEVAPGFQIQITIAPRFRLNEWLFSLGYDFWYQQKEKINFIFSPMAPSLNVCKGTKPHGYQSKIFGYVGFNKIKKRYDWSMSLSAEQTLASTGVGDDFAVSLNFEFNF